MTPKAILTAADRLAGVAHRTPVMTSRTLDEDTGAKVFLKCENFQRSGAFKFRGAFNALSALDKSQRRAGVIAYSSGNHAQALAYASKLMDVRAVLVMPKNAPQIKQQATQGYGAEVIFYDPDTEEREAVTERIQKERGLTLIPPFNHPDVIAGQGTATLELIQEVGDLDIVLAPCGGGGLLSGTSLAAKYLLPDCKVFGVEPEGANNGTLAFRSGKIERVEHPKTMADGLKPKALGELTFQVIRANVDDMLTVSEMEIRATLSFLWNRMKLVVEPSGAVSLAPVYHALPQFRGKRVGVILSGGNADIGAVADWLRAPKA